MNKQKVYMDSWGNLYIRKTILPGNDKDYVYFSFEHRRTPRSKPKHIIMFTSKTHVKNKFTCLGEL